MHGLICRYGDIVFVRKRVCQDGGGDKVLSSEECAKEGVAQDEGKGQWVWQEECADYIVTWY